MKSVSRAVPFEEVLARFSPELRAAIEESAQELYEQELTLRDLRRALDLTQKTLADTLHIEQAGVSRLERRSDMLISTLQRYVEAMGGSLHLVAEFPGRTPVSVSLGDVIARESTASS